MFNLIRRRDNSVPSTSHSQVTQELHIRFFSAPAIVTYPKKALAPRRGSTCRCRSPEHPPRTVQIQDCRTTEPSPLAATKAGRWFRRPIPKFPRPCRFDNLWRDALQEALPRLLLAGSREHVMSSGLAGTRRGDVYYYKPRRTRHTGACLVSQVVNYTTDPQRLT